MPSFCECGCDKYICQVCGRDLCSSKYPSKWMPVPGIKIEGNICPDCIKNSRKREMPRLDSLYERCRKESGFNNPRMINAYMQRYYGHN